MGRSIARAALTAVKLSPQACFVRSNCRALRLSQRHAALDTVSDVLIAHVGMVLGRGHASQRAAALLAERASGRHTAITSCRNFERHAAMNGLILLLLRDLITQGASRRCMHRSSVPGVCVGQPDGAHLAAKRGQLASQFIELFSLGQCWMSLYNAAACPWVRRLAARLARASPAHHSLSVKLVYSRQFLATGATGCKLGQWPMSGVNFPAPWLLSPHLVPRLNSRQSPQKPCEDQIRPRHLRLTFAGTHGASVRVITHSTHH